MTSRNPDRAPAPVVGIAEDYPSLDGTFHAHQRAQLVYAAEGVVTVTTARGLYVVPPQRAVWVCGGERHKVESKRAFRLRTLYLDEARLRDLPRATTVLAVGPLLRELVLAQVAAPWTWEPRSREARRVAVLLDELRQVEAAPLSLPLATDARVRRVCSALERDPADDRDLDAFARTAGASPRHLARLFVTETGLTFGAWRQQLRLLRALERLAAGASVLEVAIDLGYGSASSFGAMFRRALGTSPARYFAAM